MPKKNSNLTLYSFLLVIMIMGWLSYHIFNNKKHYHVIPIGNRLNISRQITPIEIVNYTQVSDQPVDYIDKTSSIDRLYDEISAGNFLMGIRNINEYLRPDELAKSGEPYRNDTLCGQQLDWILDKLNQHSDYLRLKGKLGYELTSLMDAFGYQEAGSFSQGTSHWLGSADLCSKVSLDSGLIRTHHCFGKFKFKSWTQIDMNYLETVVKIGLCLPRTCDTLSFQVHGEKIERLGKHHLSENLKNDLRLHSLLCLPDDESPIRQISTGGRIYLSIMGVWLATVLFATILREVNLRCDTNLFTDRTKKLIETLSVTNSLRTLRISSKFYDDKIRVDLRILDFIRITMALIIIHAHSFNMCLFYTTKFRPITVLTRESYGKIIFACARFVDTFLAIFGILMGYKLLGKFHPSHIIKPGIWFMTNFNIALRISPVFMIIYWFNALVFEHIGSGTLWDYGLDNVTLIGGCKIDDWWKSIPISSTIGEYNVPLCNTPGWFLGAYSQIALIMPFVIYLIASYKYSILRILLVGFILTISSVNIAIKMYRQKVIPIEAVSDYGGFLVAFVERYESTGYMDTLSRFGTVAVGGLFGYYLHKYDVGDIKRLPNWAVGKVTTIILLIFHVILIFLPLLDNIQDKANRPQIGIVQFSIINSVMMATWPIINSWLIFNVATSVRNNTFVNLMNNPFWHSFNKIGLTLYLVHMGVINYVISFNEESYTTGSSFDVIRTTCLATILSIIIAFLVYILFEAPINHLFNISFSKKNHDPKLPITNNN